jgi:hypothetical protein
MARHKGSPKVYTRNDEHAEMVKRLCLAGVSQEQMATVLGICKDTMYKNYKDELEQTEPKAIAVVAGKLYQKCLQGNLTAMIFYLKTRAGWREKSSIELTGENGKPLPMIEVVVKTSV